MKSESELLAKFERDMADNLASVTPRRNEVEALNKPLATEPEAGDGGHNGFAFADDVPPPAGEADYGLPSATAVGASASPMMKIEATVWRWCEPREIPPRQWLYARHLIRGFVSGTVAPGGVGKSSLVLVEAIAMATGKPLLGKRVAAPLRVWYWNLEDPQEELDRRIAAICLHYGIRPDDLSDRLHINSGRDQPCIVARQVSGGPVILVPVVDSIIAEIQARQIDVLLVDPFVSCHKVGENDNGAQDMIVKEAWGRVAK